MVSIHPQPLSFLPSIPSFPIFISFRLLPDHSVSTPNPIIMNKAVKTMALLEKHLLLLALLCAALLLRDATGSRVQMGHRKNSKDYGISSAEREISLEENPRRYLIGSVAPTCTYNECRGCRYKCRAEQVPVEGNDPINSAYHYKCVCHR